jgi:ABC transporter DrrB family efflux protein
MTSPASSVPAIRVEQVSKRFGDTLALSGVDLEVPEGIVFGLLGPNGAGKTTLVRVLTTLLTPDAGRAEVFGLDVATDAPAVRELIGLTGQFAAVDEILSGRENLEMFGRLFDLSSAQASERADELLRRFDLADAADRPARTYSGGMRRRLDLASSLLTRPRILFLDEPTTGLDPRSRNQIWTIVRELVRDGTTILLTTQYLEEADELADRIAVIDHGRLIAQGTGASLKERVGGLILEVELTDAARRDQAQSVLAGVGCGDPEPDERPDRLSLPAPGQGLELVEHAAAALRRADISVSNLALRGPTLDDVFLQLTGLPPSTNGAGPTTAAANGSGAGSDGAGVARAGADGAGAGNGTDGNGVAGAGASEPTSADPVHAPRHARRWHQPSLSDVRSAVTDSWIVTGRNLRHFIRQPQLLIFSTIQPVMFVLLFAYVFGGAIKGSLPHGVSYIDFLLPGIFVQSVAFRATQTAVGLAEDLDRGVVDRFRSMPMARSAVLVGRTVADLLRNVLIVGLMIIVGYLIGFRFRAGPVDAVASVLVVSAFGLALSWIFAFVALAVRGAEAAQSAGFVVIFPLVFASSVFVPVSSMPSWLQAFAKVSPVSLTANTARTYALHGGVPGSLAGAAAWILGLLLVFVPLCVWRYRRMG